METLVFFPDYQILKDVQREKSSPLKGDTGGELQVCQSDFSARESHGKGHLAYHHGHIQDKTREQVQSAWI